MNQNKKDERAADSQSKQDVIHIRVSYTAGVVPLSEVMRAERHFEPRQGSVTATGMTSTETLLAGLRAAIYNPISLPVIPPVKVLP